LIEKLKDYLQIALASFTVGFCIIIGARAAAMLINLF
jgi:hypothetical protein